MPSLQPYDRKLDYSYAPGIFPSMEAVRKAPQIVRRVLISSQADESQGVRELVSLCEAAFSYKELFSRGRALCEP